MVFSNFWRIYILVYSLNMLDLLVFSWTKYDIAVIRIVKVLSTWFVYIGQYAVVFICLTLILLVIFYSFLSVLCCWSLTEYILIYIYNSTCGESKNPTFQQITINSLGLLKNRKKRQNFILDINKDPTGIWFAFIFPSVDRSSEWRVFQSGL